ncbi:MAG: BadF/BadG/BcrA/BcrD ATPase family protein [Paracoccaceae bacterium]
MPSSLSTPARYLGVDIGGTGSRWVCVDATGAEVARGETCGATGLLFDERARARFHDALAPIPGPVTAACLGVTGAGFDSDAAVIDAARAALNGTEVEILNDVELAWHAAFPDSTGHLVIAGTGSVGACRSGRGMVVVGGRGSLIDDAGSGTWIALRALDRVYRAIDRHGRPEGVEILSDALFGAMGGSDWESTRRFVYDSLRGQVGTLARPVAEAAQAGDAAALALLVAAGQELARLVKATARCGPAPVRATGGVFNLHPAVAQSMRDSLPDVAISFGPLDAAAHAAQRARHRKGTA